MIVIRVLGILFVLAIVIFFIIENWKMIEEAEREQDSDYEAPQLKKLTEEQIADIHARGKITPEKN